MRKSKVISVYLRRSNSTIILYPLFKLPIQIADEKFFVVYAVPRNVQKSDEDGVLKSLYFLLTTEKGTFTSPILFASAYDSLPEWMFEDWTKQISDEKMFRKIYRNISEFLDTFTEFLKVDVTRIHSNSGKKYSVPDVSKIPTYYSVSQYFHDRKNIVLPFEMNLSYMKHVTLNSSDVRFQQIAKKYYKKLFVLYDKLNVLFENQIELLKKGEFDKLKHLKEHIWTERYKKQIINIIIDAYENYAGHRLFPFNLLEDKSLEDKDKSMLLFVHDIVGIETDDSFVDVVKQVYKERGIDYEKALTLYNENKIAYALKNGIPFYAINFTDNSNMGTYVRIVDKKNVERDSDGRYFIFDYKLFEGLFRNMHNKKYIDVGYYDDYLSLTVPGQNEVSL